VGITIIALLLVNDDWWSYASQSDNLCIFVQQNAGGGGELFEQVRHIQFGNVELGILENGFSKLFSGYTHPVNLDAWLKGLLLEAHHLRALGLSKPHLAPTLLTSPVHDRCFSWYICYAYLICGF